MRMVLAKRDGMNIVALADGKAYTARPDGWDKPGFWEAVKRAFTLKYQVFDSEDAEICQVHYDFPHSFILVKRPEGDRQIKLPIFDLFAQRYYMKEKITGFLIWPLTGDGRIDIVCEGEKSMKEYSMEVKSDDENIDSIALELAIGYMIRWMSFNIGI